MNADPYDRAAIIDACASHSWERHGNEFVSHGIASESDLRDHISATLEHEDTQAFRCQPQIVRDQTFGREIYSLPFEDSPKGEGYSTSIILNPNLDENDNYYGGTCLIRADNKGVFAQLQKKEIDDTGVEPEIVIGGRPALREQEQDRQIVPAERDSPASLDTAQTSPQTLEEYLQQCENLAAESLDYTPQELPRTFEEYVRHYENLYPEQSRDKDQEQDLER